MTTPHPAFQQAAYALKTLQANFWFPIPVVNWIGPHIDFRSPFVRNPITAYFSRPTPTR